MEGEVADQHAVRWPKDNKGAWVLLCAFDPAALPDAKALQSAKLVVSVRESHEKAPAQAAAVLLNAPFTPGKAYDFAALGQTVGTATIGKGGGSPFPAPRPCEIDVTAAVRAWRAASKPAAPPRAALPSVALRSGSSPTAPSTTDGPFASPRTRSDRSS